MPKLTTIQKNGRKILLRGLCEMIAAAKKKNKSNKVPYGYYQRVLSDIKLESPWVTLDILKKAFRGYEAAVAAKEDAPPTSISVMSSDYLSDISAPSSSDSLTNNSATATTRDGADVSATIQLTQRSKGGRSKGSTDNAKDHKQKAVIALQNEIVALYLAEKKNCGKKSMRRGRLKDLKGLRVDTGVEIGLDEFARVIGERGDKDFVLKNSGAGNMFPGGPTCCFRGKDVPCFVRWSEKGSMTSSILRDILADLDQRGLFPRSDNPHLRPFALFDGHGSRIEFEFLNYINDAGHQWVVCIGVPYGTATWQVGDSKEQNGSFNIALARAKINLVKKKAEHCLPAVINRTDIVVILNEAWKHSFGRVEKNRKAIADRGWNPLNRNILCLKEVIGAMTDEDKEKDELVPYKQKGTKIHDNSKPEYDAMYLPGSTPNIISLDKVNMDDGIASQVIQDIVQHAELMNVREMIAKKKQEGSIIADRLKAVKKLTAGQIFTSGTTRLGKDVFQALQEKINKKDEEVRKKNNDKKKECEQARAKVQEIRQKRKEPSDLNNKELTTMLKYKRRKTDRKLPTKKQDMLSLYHHWYTEGQPFFRPSPVCSPNVSDAESDMEMSVVDDDDVDIVIPIEKV